MRSPVCPGVRKRFSQHKLGTQEFARLCPMVHVTVMHLQAHSKSNFPGGEL